MPSNSTKIRREACSVGSVKSLRYQPTPAGKKPPAPLVGLFRSNGPSMLQSCGRSSLRQAESSKRGACAWLASPLKKSHEESKAEVTRTGVAPPAALPNDETRT